MSILDIDICAEDYHHEYLYSRLLEWMIPLVDSVMNEKTKWRLQEQFIEKLGSILHYFNPLEMQELILPKILDRIKESCD